MVILNLKHVWQVATKGAQQKLNDKDMEEKEKLWQESFGKQIKFTFFPPKKWIFIGLPIFLYKHMTSEETEEVKTKINVKRHLNWIYPWKYAEQFDPHPHTHVWTFSPLSFF